MMRFVGAHRIASVDAVDAAFASAVAHGEPRLISIEAPQGWGKTRVVQEFYERLTPRQAPPAYWPDSLREDAVAHPRKVITPRRVDVQGKARMPWMWWGIHCNEAQVGAPEAVLANELEQLQLHAEPILATRENLKDVATSVAGVGMELTGIDLAVTVAGTLRHGVEAARDVRAARRPRIVDTAESARAPHVARAIEILANLGGSGVPSVVVVDDAHLASPGVVGLLYAIMFGELAAPVLVVLTAWPDRLAAQRREGERGTMGVFLEDVEALRGERHTRWTLDPLSATDLAELVRERAPATARDVAGAFAQRADGNPLVLDLLLRSDSVLDATRDGRIDVTVGDIATLPANQFDILRGRWVRLPDDVRKALCLCSLQGRAVVEDLLLHTYETVKPAHRDRASSCVAEAVTPYEWLRRLEAPLLEFSEASNLEIATKGAADAIVPREARCGARGDRSQDRGLEVRDGGMGAA